MIVTGCITTTLKKYRFVTTRLSSGFVRKKTTDVDSDTQPINLKKSTETNSMMKTARIIWAGFASLVLNVNSNTIDLNYVKTTWLASVRTAQIVQTTI